jgi:hypothetical protein
VALLIASCVLTGRVSLAAKERECVYPVQHYGTYSVGRKAGAAKVSLVSRLRELRELGVNMILATGRSTKILDVLPDGMRAVPGCGLMKRDDWKKDGRWDEAHARSKLTRLAARFARHPRVLGVCLTHEVTEYADQERRVWMYRLAKEYFQDKKVLHYYGRLWDDINPKRKKVYGYGLGGTVETDVVFVGLSAARNGRFKGVARIPGLEKALTYVARTPGIPVWAQTSINADHGYVTGPQSMLAVWGERGENMIAWTDALFGTVRRDANGDPLRLTGFFWRSFGRFPYDLGYPGFTAHRAQLRAIADRICDTP